MPILTKKIVANGSNHTEENNHEYQRKCHWQITFYFFLIYVQYLSIKFISEIFLSIYVVINNLYEFGLYSV